MSGDENVPKVEQEFEEVDVVKEVSDKGENDEWTDLLGTGVILKKIVKAGKPDYRPQKQDICILNYTCTLEDGTEVEKHENVRIQQGDCEVTHGMDIALAMMNIEERCILKVQPRLGYGSLGLPPKIPPDANLVYDIELLSVDFEYLETMKIEQRKEKGLAKKERGNWWYGRDEPTIAIQCYRRALDYLDEAEGGITDPEPDNAIESDPERKAREDAMLQDMLEERICVHNNMAQAQLKLGAHDAALTSLQNVLRCQPNNVKALYRKSKILKERNDLDGALSCLQKAIKAEPENTTIQNEIKRINAVLKVHQKHEKEIAKRMFTGMINNKDDSNEPNKQMSKTLFMWMSLVGSVAVGIIGLALYKYKS